MRDDTTLHPLDVQLGTPDTRIVVCPDCGQMELWTEAERADHGLCRTAGRACWCEDEED